MIKAEQLRKNFAQPGILAALGSALLFGSGTPLAKMLLADVSPWLMAALLYLGSGIGLSLYRVAKRAPSVRLPSSEWPWLSGAIFAGGVLGPGLQMLGLTRMPASGPSLLLNAESVFTRFWHGSSSKKTMTSASRSEWGRFLPDC
jgi:drug/metabolite transporter (DMT)-like permease